MKKYIKILYPHFIAYGLIAPIPILFAMEASSSSAVAWIYIFYLVGCVVVSGAITLFRSPHF